MLSLLCSGVCDALSCAQVLLCEPHLSLPALVSELYSLASRFFHEWFPPALKSCRIGVVRARGRPWPLLDGQHLDNATESMVPSAASLCGLGHGDLTQS